MLCCAVLCYAVLCCAVCCAVHGVCVCVFTNKCINACVLCLCLCDCIGYVRVCLCTYSRIVYMSMLYAQIFSMYVHMSVCPCVCMYVYGMAITPHQSTHTYTHTSMPVPLHKEEHHFILERCSYTTEKSLWLRPVSQRLVYVDRASRPVGRGILRDSAASTASRRSFFIKTATIKNKVG